MAKHHLALLFCALSVSFCTVSAFAKEYPIGKPQEQAGMEIGAVFLQAIEMDPPDVMRPAKDFGHSSRSRHQSGQEQSERICARRLDPLSRGQLCVDET